MKEVRSILDFADGGIADRVQAEVDSILSNIADPNTDIKAREITIKLTLTPAEDRKFISLQAQVSKKIRPYHPVKTAMRLNQNEAVELTSYADGQMDITGQVNETKVLKLVKKAGNE